VKNEFSVDFGQIGKFTDLGKNDLPFLTNFAGF